MFRIDRQMVKLTEAPAIRVDAGERPPGKDEKAEVEARAEQMERAELEAEALAEEIVLRAEAEAEGLLREAREQAERLKEQAQSEGYADGRAAGDEESERRRQEDEESIKRVLSEIERERSRIIDEIEGEVIELTFSMVKKIINLAEEMDDKLFESMIIKALRKVKLEGWVTIRVSSAEYEKYFSSGSAAFVLGEETVSASVIPDSSLESWDCVIDTGDVTLNAGLDSQLNLIRIAFNGVTQL